MCKLTEFLRGNDKSLLFFLEINANGEQMVPERGCKNKPVTLPSAISSLILFVTVSQLDNADGCSFEIC